MIPYKLLDWIPESAINYNTLSLNPRATRLLEKNQDKINWSILSSNPEAIHILEDNLGKIDWRELSSNPAAIRLLEKNQDKIVWYRLSANPAAVDLLEKNQDKIVWRELTKNTNPDAFNLFEKNYFKLMYYDWYALCKNPHAISFIEIELRTTKLIDGFYKWFCCCRPFNSICKIKWGSLCLNTNPAAIRMLEENPDKIDWSTLSRNPAAIRLLEKNPDKIVWFNLSSNSEAIHILENEIQTNPHNRINWELLSKNSKAIHILEKYPEHISWFHINENTNPEAMRMIETHWKTYYQTYYHLPWCTLSKNPNIFTYDYQEMSRSKIQLHEELIRNMFHPTNIEKFEDWGFANGFTNDNDIQQST